MGHPYYERKIKDLLFHSAIGMNTVEVWDGSKYNKNGLIILESNNILDDILIYNKEEFQKYLLINTKLEQASSSEDENNFGNAKSENAKPYKFGWVYEEEGEYFVKLNLQIRFTN